MTPSVHVSIVERCVCPLTRCFSATEQPRIDSNSAIVSCAYNLTSFRCVASLPSAVRLSARSFSNRSVSGMCDRMPIKNPSLIGTDWRPGTTTPFAACRIANSTSSRWDATIGRVVPPYVPGGSPVHDSPALTICSIVSKTRPTAFSRTESPATVTR